MSFLLNWATNKESLWIVMKRIHEERKDIFSGIREGVLTSPASIRNITINQNMEKDKLEKPNYGQHSFGKIIVILSFVFHR